MYYECRDELTIGDDGTTVTVNGTAVNFNSSGGDSAFKELVKKSNAGEPTERMNEAFAAFYADKGIPQDKLCRTKKGVRDPPGVDAFDNHPAMYYPLDMVKYQGREYRLASRKHE